MEQENGWWKFQHHKWCFRGHSTVQGLPPLLLRCLQPALTATVATAVGTVDFMVQWALWYSGLYGTVGSLVHNMWLSGTVGSLVGYRWLSDTVDSAADTIGGCLFIGHRFEEVFCTVGTGDPLVDYSWVCPYW